MCSEPSDDLFVDYLLERCCVEKNQETREVCWAILEHVAAKYDGSAESEDRVVATAFAKDVAGDIIDLVKKIKDGIGSVGVGGVPVLPQTKKKKWSYKIWQNI